MTVVIEFGVGLRPILNSTSADFGTGLETDLKVYSARTGHKSGRICVRYLLSLAFGIGFTLISKKRECFEFGTFLDRFQSV